MPLVTLTTDFGTSDPYVGVMHGLIHAIAPAAHLADLTHALPPQDILAGALALEHVLDVLPPDAIHLAVVDPGVGSARAAVALRTDRGVFVGPDNGLFTLVLRRASLEQAARIEEPRFRRQHISRTFHGRDLFAPAAAHLAAGVPLAELGPPTAELVRLELPEPVVEADTIRAHVLHADHFGNLITDTDHPTLTAWIGAAGPGGVRVTTGQRRWAGLHNCYSDVGRGEPLAYVGSTGRLEIGVRNGSAARTLGLGRGDQVRLTRG